MAETDDHRELMFALIKALDAYYANDSMVYVSGNLLLFYEPGNRRRHVSPDVFVVKGVPKHRRPNYLTWVEGRGPDVVIELTSSSTRDEDVEDKFRLYRDSLQVKEYFLFDPHEDYLEPPFQGHRLEQGQYVPIAPEEGRLPSAVLGLHLERDGAELRLYDPATAHWLPTPEEAVAEAQAARQAGEARQQQEQAARQAAEARQQLAEAARQAAEARQQQAETARQAAEARQQQTEIARQAAEARQQQAEAAQQAAEARQQQAEADVERLRRELEELRRRLPLAGDQGPPPS
jgi:Uma2 family endonuclease